MDQAQFRELVAEFLAPMLGARLLDVSLQSSPKEKAVAYDPNYCNIALKPAQSDDYRVRINRSKKFTAGEWKLAEDFVKEVRQLDGLQDKSYFADLLRALPRWVVARYISSSTLLRTVLECLEEWSSQTYEGHRITCAIGLIPDDATTGLQLEEYWDESYAPVLSNGFDTLVVVGSDRQVLGMRQLDPPATTSFAPYRFGSIAEWTKQEEGRVAVTLNYHGEILVFKDGLLRFSKRSGRWVHYVHDNAITTMSPCGGEQLRTAIYESCLDVSFARTGGCLSVVLKKAEELFPNFVKLQDRIEETESYKTRLLAAALQGPFQKLDRRLRQELLAMDGAVVLDREGTVLAAGAIVSVEGGSEGGGRLAAAKELSKLGLGIKISEDGPIDIFKKEERVLEIGERSGTTSDPSDSTESKTS